MSGFKVRTVLDTGQDDADCNGEYRTVGFGTEAEAKAFMSGVSVASSATNGWLDGSLDAELVTESTASVPSVPVSGVELERARRICTGEVKATTDVQRAAAEAWPKSDEDYGTERQLNAERVFFNLICAETSWDTDADETWNEWRLKATSEELIAGALVCRGQVTAATPPAPPYAFSRAQLVKLIGFYTNITQAAVDQNLDRVIERELGVKA